MNKKSILIVVSLSVLFGIYAVFLYFATGANHSSKGYIIVSELGGYYCNGRNCSYHEIQDMEIENHNIDIFKENLYVNVYQLKYINHWNFYQNGTWNNFYGDFVGFETSLEKNVFPYRYEDIHWKNKILF